MKTRMLTLIRHAEAGSLHGSRIADHNRPLTERGRKDARQLATRLQAAGFLPDSMWTSDAERAETTARLIQAGIGLSDAAVAVRAGLYLAHTKTLVDLIGHAGDDISSLAVVGHNPGLSDLWDWLCDKPGLGLPTCGIVCLELGISRWSDLHQGCANLRDFGTPALTFAP
jgi:phosphohistidine phosphatase